MDRVAFISATRFGRVPFVTASCERIDFKKPAQVGELVEFVARPTRAGRRSMTIEVDMVAEAIQGRKRELCTRGIFNMVAMPEGDMAEGFALPPLDVTQTDDHGCDNSMVEIVFPDQANSVGRMFGGEAIAFMTKAAFIAASRHSGQVSVLASSEKIDFARPIAIGEIVEAVTRIVKVGNSSMTVETVLWSEVLLTGERHVTATGLFTMVAVNEQHQPVPVCKASS